MNGLTIILYILVSFLFDFAFLSFSKLSYTEACYGHSFLSEI